MHIYGETSPARQRGIDAQRKAKPPLRDMLFDAMKGYDNLADLYADFEAHIAGRHDVCGYRLEGLANRLARRGWELQRVQDRHNPATK